MRVWFFLSYLLLFKNGYSQADKTIQPTVNVRLSFLLFPFTPLLTIETTTFGKLTLQLETNFVSTHVINLKYFVKDKMNGHFVFTGVAFIENKLLRKDRKMTFLPYAGYGYAYRFGINNVWTLDNRVGIGATVNADTKGFYPVIKTGIGYVF